MVETFRDWDRVRHRMVLYIGDYATLTDALRQMLRQGKAYRARATRNGDEKARRQAEEIDAKLAVLEALVEEHPELVERERRKREALGEWG